MDVRKVPQDVAAMYFVINCFSGETFSEVETVDAQLTVQANEGPMEGFAEFPLGVGGDHKYASARAARWTASVLRACWLADLHSTGSSSSSRVNKSADLGIP